jgi:hypothetical protein
VLKVLLPSSVASASRDAEQGITIPVNYAEVSGGAAAVLEGWPDMRSSKVHDFPEPPNCYC